MRFLLQLVDVFVNVNLLDIVCCLWYTLFMSYYIEIPKEWIMADKPLVDVPSGRTVSAAEIEAFKLERVAEWAFIVGLRLLVQELANKVSPRNTILQSMNRFLKSRQ